MAKLLRRRLKVWLRLSRRVREEDLEAEIRAHLHMASRDRIDGGESPETAGQTAQRELGNLLLLKEVMRDTWGWTRWDHLAQDTRYALRTLRRNPGFGLTVVMSLALGIGATAAAFSLADAALLRPLPVSDPRSVVTISTESPSRDIEEMSYPDLSDLQQRTQSLAGVVAYRTSRVAFARLADAVPQVRFCHRVTSGFFRRLGVEPVLGRAFTDEETRTSGRDRVVVLSHQFWRAEFGADARVVGTMVRVNGEPYTIVGVAPDRFTGLNQFIHPSFYVPLTTLARPDSPTMNPLENRADRSLIVKARLAPGVSRNEAQAELAVLASALQHAYPDSNQGRSFTIRTELQARAADAPPLVIVSSLLMAVTGLVLVIAALNVATLLLARASARSREIAVRLAIGAGGARLLRQLLTESLVLSLCGGAVGVAVAWGAIRLLASFQLPTDTPIVIDVRLDHRVLLFALIASVTSVLIFGLVPAWRTARPDLVRALKSDGGGTGRRLRLTGRKVLVASQVALSVILLVTASALLDAFSRMLVLDPGIRTRDILMMEFDPSLIGYSPERAGEFYRLVAERTREVPAVRAATLASSVPFRPNFFDPEVVPEGYELPRDRRSVRVSANAVDDRYFATMGVEIVRGRGFGSEDRATSRPVAVVNEAFADRYWPGQDAVGKRLRLGTDGPYTQVVGVARTGRYLTLQESPQPYLYLPFTQHPRNRMTLLVQTAGEPLVLVGAIEAVIRSIDPNQPVSNVRAFQTYFDRGPLAMPRLVMQMVGSAGVAGVALALVGLYGLVAYYVSQYTREIGIRMAIGASRREVLGFVLRQGLLLSLAGALAGLAMSVPLFRALAAGLSGVGSLSWWTLVIVPAVLMCVALAACWIPARRATRIPPVIVLRYD